MNENQAAGNHSVVWNGKNESGEILDSGIYFYQLRTDNSELSGQTKKMLIIK